MTASRRGAYTLIELLIVVAILSILAAASMRMIVGPMQEQVFASIEHGQLSGSSMLIARWVEEAHSAKRILPLNNGFELQGALSGGEKSVRYEVGAENNLRRTVLPATEGRETSGSALLENVEVLSATPETTPGLWTIRLSAAQQRYGREVLTENQVTLRVGFSSNAEQEAAQ